MQRTTWMMMGAAATVAAVACGGDDAPSPVSPTPPGAGGGATGGGGQAPAPVTSVTVEEWDGSPASQVEVVFVDAAGEVIERQTTGDDGQAEAVVPQGGGAMIAVTYTERRGDSNVQVYRRVNGALGVEAGGDLAFQLTQPREQIFGAPRILNVTLTSPLPANTIAYVIPACYSELGVLSGSNGTTIGYQGCPGETTNSSAFVYLVDNDGDVLGQDVWNLSLTGDTGRLFDPGDVTPATTVDSFATGNAPTALILGLGEGSVHALTLNPFGSQVPVPPDFGASFWITQQVQPTDEFEPSLGEWRRLSAALTEPGFTAVTFPMPSSAVVTAVITMDPTRPTVEWIRDETFPGDYASVSFAWSAPDADGVSMNIAVPADRTSVQAPALPDELAAYRPASDGLGAQLTVVDVEGEEAPFAAQAAAARRTSPLLQWSIPAP